MGMGMVMVMVMVKPHHFLLTVWTSASASYDGTRIMGHFPIRGTTIHIFLLFNAH